MYVLPDIELLITQQVRMANDEEGGGERGGGGRKLDGRS